MMPPPNVTAALHMGHGLNNTVQDVLVRFERMRGRARALAAGHRSRRHRDAERGRATSRRRRVRRASTSGARPSWHGSGPTSARRAPPFSRSFARIGCSADWSRTYFTLDEGLSRAVREAFVPLYDEGPRSTAGTTSSTGARAASPPCRTRRPRRRRWMATSGISRYPLAERERPCHRGHHAPRDDAGRYRGRGASRTTSATADWSAGSSVCRSSIGSIPIVADDAVDPAFGTGAVKVTPAHDPADFEIGRRHDLAEHRHHDARRADQPRRAGAFPGPRSLRGAPRRSSPSSRPRGLLEKVEPHRHAVRSLLPLRHGHRAETLRSVVRADGATRRARRSRRTATAPFAVHPRAPG